MLNTQTDKAGERTQHTLGPWEWNGMATIGKPDNGDWQYGIQIARILPIEPRVSHGEREANARLIAASPDGHVILRMMKDWLDADGTGVHFDTLMPEGDDDTETLGDAIRAYFAKIEGK